LTRRDASPAARGAVRIQAGKWKGRKLEVPRSARPTSGRARAALFDLLGPSRLRDARFLDLYAGSGAVGFEAVSRGAAAAVLVDSDSRAISRSSDRVGAGPDEVRVLAEDVLSAVRRLARSGERFDVIFVDPPYGEAGGAPIDAASGLLAPGGVFVVQTDAGHDVSAPAGLTLESRRPYGRNVFHFFRMF
jgi:16S rRNA (guanine(966)-N(2))-methyltransferase RsmD